ncbi:Methyltransferase type 11 [Spirochaeta thermophila DSM 6578]|uniref:Methyltransferase type 11 n=1 Tax=Winmispira thermophila (strain ATCC 700085 / DSM 6578 / Z-1203) TaxID=869211 RepID=G0G9S6_WINT7|nr:class I SAM-dependent methyltransferase [Spirochaeta thermophila]AEJ60826.1 Methyltransferase type 11 [Spirochaeta thermophila DSM 6578]
MREFFDRIQGYYVKRLKKFSRSPRERHLAVGWESRDAQERRFRVLLDHVPLEGGSLLDVGCGLGDLYGFLKREGVACDYTGMDILPAMVEQARTSWPEGRFMVGDVCSEDLFPPHSFDVVYASGMFNLRVKDNYAFLGRALGVFRSLARRAVVCSMLSVKSPFPEPEYFYYEVDRVRRLAEAGPWRVEVMEHYMDNDLTLVCRKGGL